jgi:hypothetical protein
LVAAGAVLAAVVLGDALVVIRGPYVFMQGCL